MKPLITLFISLFLLTTLAGCFSVEKYNNFIKEKTGRKVAENGPYSNEYLTISSDAMKGADSVVRSRKTKTSFIPAILYWQWNYSIESNLGYIIPMNIIRPTIFNYAEAIRLKDKLNGKRLEISVEKIPSSFTHSEKGVALVFIIAYTVNGQEVIYPSNDELVVSFRITSEGNEIKRGTVTIKEPVQPVTNKNLRSSKKFVWTYIDDYYGSIKGLSKSVVNQIAEKI